MDSVETLLEDSHAGSFHASYVYGKRQQLAAF